MTQVARAGAPEAEALSVAARWESSHVPNYATPGLELVRGEGAWLWDAQGRRYLDLLAGIAVNVLGHAHPELVAAVQDQVARLGHVSNLYASDAELAFAARLQDATGGRKAVVVNSGTEANEAALKLVRRRAHAEGMSDGVVLAFEGSFHGRTLGALALTGQPAHRDGFEPLPAGVRHVPYDDVAALEAAFDEEQVVGFFAEYVQGEGGVNPMPAATADAVKRLARRDGALLVADEVQTGVGRTGRFLAAEHHGHDPDVVTLAKGLGGGLPIGACLVKPEHAHHLPPGSHGCTFGGNPIAAAAGRVVLDVVARDRLAARAEALGKRFRERLVEAGGDAAAPRGLGLLLGVPLGAPVAPAVVAALQADGVLVGQAGKRVVRFAPPLTVPEDEFLGAAPTVAAALGRHGSG